MFSFFSKLTSANVGNAYDYIFSGIDGDTIKLSDYKDKVIVVVNVASRCGYTPQYEDLQSLWSKYKDKNLVVIYLLIILDKNLGQTKKLRIFVRQLWH